MLYHNYIDHSIQKQNRLIYIKNGRFIALIIIAFISIFLFSDNSYIISNLETDNALLENPVYQFLYGLIITIPFVIFMIWFCITLIPQYFKRSLYKQFWLKLISGLATTILLTYLLHCLLISGIKPFGDLFENNIGIIPLQTIIFNTIFNFLQFMSWLFLVESFENIHLIRDTQKLDQEYEAIKSNREMRAFNSDYLFQSLDNIIHLAEKNDAGTPQYILDFAQSLRYKLYFREQKVGFNEEIEQLKNLLSVYNIDKSQYHISIIGQNNDIAIPKMSLIMILDGILIHLNKNDFFYLDIVCHYEEAQLLIAFDLQFQNEHAKTIIDQIANYLSNLVAETTIEIQKTIHSINIQLCLTVSNQ